VSPGDQEADHRRDDRPVEQREEAVEGLSASKKAGDGPAGNKDLLRGGLKKDPCHAETQQDDQGP
jgi:hypothetical protein